MGNLLRITNYVPHDIESAGWAAVIRSTNLDAPTPPGFELEQRPRRHA